MIVGTEYPVLVPTLYSYTITCRQYAVIQLAYSHAYTNSITAQIWGLEALRERAGGERRRLRDGALGQALRALRDSRAGSRELKGQA